MRVIVAIVNIGMNPRSIHVCVTELPVFIQVINGHMSVRMDCGPHMKRSRFDTINQDQETQILTKRTHRIGLRAGHAIDFNSL